MNKLLAVALLSVGAIGSAAAQVNVSVGINQPGVYGRINIGDVPRPALVRSEPVIIRAPRVAVQMAPVYLYVPTAQQQSWSRYCGRYNACGQPVYFVREDYVRERYGSEHPGWNHGKKKGWDKNGKNDEHGDNGHGAGNGHGNGNGKGH